MQHRALVAQQAGDAALVKTANFEHGLAGDVDSVCFARHQYLQPRKVGGFEPVAFDCCHHVLHLMVCVLCRLADVDMLPRPTAGERTENRQCNSKR